VEAPKENIKSFCAKLFGKEIAPEKLREEEEVAEVEEEVAEFGGTPCLLGRHSHHHHSLV